MSAAVQTDALGGAVEPIEVIVRRIKEAVKVLEKAEDRRAGMAKDLAECKRRVEAEYIEKPYVAALRAAIAESNGETPWHCWLRLNFPEASLKYLTNEAALGARELAQPGAIDKERTRARGGKEVARDEPAGAAGSYHPACNYRPGCRRRRRGAGATRR
jgi:hypothetical protein